MPADEPSSVTRRAAVSAVTTAPLLALAGCFSLGSGPTPELGFYNFTDEAVTVDAEIRYVDDGELVIDEQFTLPDWEGKYYPDPYPRDGEVELDVVVNDERHETLTFSASGEQTESSRTIEIHEDEIHDQLGAP